MEVYRNIAGKYIEKLKSSVLIALAGEMGDTVIKGIDLQGAGTAGDDVR